MEKNQHVSLYYHLIDAVNVKTLSLHFFSDKKLQSAPLTRCLRLILSAA